MTHPLDRRRPVRQVDFGDMPTVPMDLYPQDNAIPTAEVVRELEVESWEEFVDAVEERPA